MRTLTPVGILLLSVTSAAASDVPVSVSTCLAKAGSGYPVERKIDPYVLHGDFDGDGKPDDAVLVTRNHQQGIVVCRTGGSPIVLGAGVTFNYMANLDFTAWRVHPRNQRVGRGATTRRPPALTSDALLLEWESGSGLVYWNGKRFVWYQQGD